MKFSNKMSKMYFISFAIAAIVLLYYNIWWGIAAICVEAVASYKLFINKKKEQEEWTQYIESLSMTMDYTTKKAVTNMPIPLCVCGEDGTLSWYNRKFVDIAGKKGLIGTKVCQIFEEFSMEELRSKIGKGSYYINNKGSRYRIEFFYDHSGKNRSEEVYTLYFIDVTDYENLTREYRMSRPAILTIQIDSLDEVNNSTAEEYIPVLELQIEKAIKSWAEENKAAFRKCSSDKYFLVMTEERLIAIEREKFQILDEIRSIDEGNSLPVTISIGASSYDGNSIRSTQIASFSALDLALGRGGDQAVVKRNDRYVFFGGKSKAIEKRTRVKARIISHAMKDLIQESSNVIVMGHTYPDLDALGACMGVVGIARMLNKESNIVMCTPNKSIDVMYNKIKEIDFYKEIFINKEEAMKKMTEDTLLIVVDTHRPSFTDAPKLIDMTEKIMMIDHHRRGVEFLDKAVLVYHETYASSSSEMVTELIQYIKDKPYIDTITSEGLLAGIMLDTKNFSFKTGVRTFEAAAFLRKSGADTVEVRTLFQGDASMYLLKAEAIKNVKILGEKIAVSYLDSEIPDFKLAASQSADELLNIKGVKASFVIARDGEGHIQVSARSLGDINVQVVMEKLGGGGHITTAAAQFTNVSTEEALEKVEDVIMEYIQEED